MLNAHKYSISVVEYDKLLDVANVTLESLSRFMLNKAPLAE